MKINNIDVVCPGTMNMVNLSFRDPGATNPYNAKSIDGLDADQIIPKYYGRSQNSNNPYYTLSKSRQDVVVRVNLNPDFSIGKSYSDLRDDIYRLISSSRAGAVRLRFKNNADVVAYLEGFVSKIEAPHFEEVQEMLITIQCEDSMLRSETPIAVDLTDYDGVALGVYNNLSTAPCGFKLEMTFDFDTPSYVIQDLPIPNWFFLMTQVGEFQTADKLYFSSELNNKYVYVERGLATIHLIDKIEPHSVWPLLFPGYNLFVNTVGARLDALSYFPTFWGV